MKEAATPDSICAQFAEQQTKLTVRSLEDGMVLIEGSAKALELIGALLLAQARSKADCGFQISPSGAGNALFTSESNLGVYIYRLPCAHGATK